jgi:crotonobetainyl-CoA:carnitine CoA-transferase CaiB-like acyl-CoA transferase
MLCQLGAEVIKIEPPGKGDDFRHYTEHAGLPGMSIPFAAVNAGKRSLTLNLKTEEGVAIARRLAATSDIVVENFRPGVIDRLGLGYESLKAESPSLIFLSLSGFGQSGPMRDWGAYDHIAQAVSGMAMMNAIGDAPQKVGMPIIDSFSGYLGALGLLAALRKRDATGHGEALDVSMLDAALKLIATGVSVYFHTGDAPKGTGNRGYRMVATAEYYPTAEGWIALGANHQHQIKAMLRAFGHEALIADPRFADHASRVANYDALKQWLTAYLATRRAADVEADLTSAGVPAAMIRDVGQIVRDPHIEERDLLRDVRLPGFEEPLKVVGPGFAAERHAELPSVPTLGAQTEDILVELGYSPAEVERLRLQRVV